MQAPETPVLINVEPFAINDSVPKEPEIRAVVKGMHNGRAGGTSGVKAKHIKQWLRIMLMEEEKGIERLGDNKRQLFVELIQIIWAEGKFPQQMGWRRLLRHRIIETILEGD